MRQNNDEIVDVVDAHDNLLGEHYLSAVHKKKLLHRGVLVMLFNTQGELYITKRGSENIFYAFKLQGTLTGHSKAGEAYYQTALRELREELGINTAPRKLHEILTFGFHDENERMFVKLYVLKNWDGPVRIDQDEVMQGEFWSVRDVITQMHTDPNQFSPAFLKAWRIFSDLNESTRDYLPFR